MHAIGVRGTGWEPGDAVARLAAALSLTCALGGCGQGDTSLPDPTPAATLSPQAQLGEKIFNDTSLSASGLQSCGTCHDATRAHAGADDFAVPLGGRTMATTGFRNAPSLDYLGQNPAFFFDRDGTPTGGFNRDGRADTLAAQARRPFLAAHEMANGTPRAFAKKLATAAYAADVRALFGADVFDDPEAAMRAATFALERFETEDPSFNAFTSKYDAFLRGEATLTPQEQRGLALYVSPTKGNCAACHPSNVVDGQLPLFTDFTYDNLGIPRNPDIPANDDPSYFDLGLCGPDRTDLAADHPDLCGVFKVPTLRNIALTAPYFHNGRFATLEETLRFYVRRDTNPEAFYPTGLAGVEKFDDLPTEFRRNVNTTEAPYNRPLGGAPALTDAEIDDVIAFLNTLTDGYTP